MTLYKQMMQYFENVVNTKEFVIAIDTTGVYIFSDTDPNNITVNHARKLLRVLALEEDEAKLVFVLPESDKEYNSFAYEESSVRPFVLEVGIDSIEDLVRKLTGVRNAIFSTADIDSIVDCFQDVTVELTPFQKQLCEIGLSEKTAVAFEAARPDSINDLIELGCPPDLVEEVYDAFKDYYVQCNCDFETLDTNNYVTIDNYMRKFRLSGVLLALMSIGLWSFSLVYKQNTYLSLGIGLFCVTAISTLSKSRKLKESVVAGVFMYLEIALLCITVLFPVAKWLCVKILYVMNAVNFTTIKDWFEHLHW